MQPRAHFAGLAAETDRTWGEARRWFEGTVNIAQQTRHTLILGCRSSGMTRWRRLRNALVNARNAALTSTPNFLPGDVSCTRPSAQQITTIGSARPRRRRRVLCLQNYGRAQQQTFVLSGCADGCCIAVLCWQYYCLPLRAHNRDFASEAPPLVLARCSETRHRASHGCRAYLTAKSARILRQRVE